MQLSAIDKNTTESETQALITNGWWSVTGKIEGATLYGGWWGQSVTGKLERTTGDDRQVHHKIKKLGPDNQFDTTCRTVEWTTVCGQQVHHIVKNLGSDNQFDATCQTTEGATVGGRQIQHGIKNLDFDNQFDAT